MKKYKLEIKNLEDDIKAARKYFVRVTVDNDGEKNIGYQSVTVVKIGNKWSLYY